MELLRPASYVEVEPIDRLELDETATRAIEWSAMAASRHPMCVTDAQIDAPGPRIEHANQAYLDLFCCELDDVLGKSPRFGQGVLTDRTVLDRVRGGLTSGALVRAQAINYRFTGEAFRLRWSIDPIVDDDGEIIHYVGVMADVTAEDRLRRRLLALDTLTTRLRTMRSPDDPDDVALSLAAAVQPLVDELGNAAIRIEIPRTRPSDVFIHGLSAETDERVAMDRIPIGSFGHIDITVHPDAIHLIDMAGCVALAEQTEWSLDLLTGNRASMSTTLIG